MQCPIDGTQLVMSERHGIEIDYCPQCRGVWLDRGELDKILERAAQQEPQRPPMQQAPRYEERRPEPRYEDDRDYDPRYGGKPRKRRESFLDDLFDFG